MLFALHLPNHTLSPEVTIWATLAVVVLAVAAWMKRPATSLPAPSLFAAVVAMLFAVQMVNFPLVGGATSGHLLGTAAAVALLGPVAGAAAMALVLVAQCLLLGDGGATALGANLLNMGLVGVLAASVAMTGLRNRIAGALLAGWASTVAAALACAIELAASGVGSTTQLFTLVAQHSLLGIVEGAFTALVVVASARTTAVRPLAIAAALALAVAPFASTLPDTLESVIEQVAEIRR